jgi:hypothetical protein
VQGQQPAEAASPGPVPASSAYSRDDDDYDKVLSEYEEYLFVEDHNLLRK